VSRGEYRIGIGPLVGALGGLLLIVSLGLDWYEGVTGFTVFEALDLVLVGLALATIVPVAGELGAPVPRTAPGHALAVAGLAAVVVLSQLVNDPPAVVGDSGPGADVGIWLAVGATALMVAGAVLLGTRISLAVDVSRREAGDGARDRDVSDGATEPLPRRDGPGTS